ncbi:MAG: YfcE family phosphodiesterase [Spirochaetales bacterium]|nr:MAG: YfcE family phosphodiesterase [Spirochaetales bacterium]
MDNPVTILALTDLHGSAAYVRRLEAEIKDADLILVAGDITNFGRRKQAEALLKPLLETGVPLFAVSGNCDHSQVEDYLTEMGINASAGTASIKNLNIFGLSGSLTTPVPTPRTFSEEEFAGLIADETRALSVGELGILLTHQPPFNTAVDAVRSGMHVGSRVIRKFIEDSKPLVCVSGHIHESFGRGTIGTSILVNPGPFHDGRYAVIQLSAGHAEARLKSF